MNEAKNYTIRVLNDQYVIQSDECEDLVHRAAQLVDACMLEILEKSKYVDHKKAAVLAALRLASQLVKQEAQLEGIHYKEQELLAAIDGVC